MYSNQKGLSLTNLLVTIAILGILSAILFESYLAYNQLLTNQLTRGDLEIQTTVALKKMAEQIRNGTQIIGSRTINSVSYTTDKETIIVELPAIDANKEVILTKFDYLVYYLNPSDKTFLRSSLQPDATSSRQGFSDQFMLRDISILRISYDTQDPSQASRVSIFLKTEKIVKNTPQTATLQTDLTLRNK